MKYFTAKRFVLALAIAGAFLIGYASATKAWPLYGRDPFYGYFTNVRDTAGDDVFYGGIPHSVNTADKFINFILGKLAAGPGTQDGTGAAFIIQTMIGSSRNKPPTAPEIDRWKRAVKYAEVKGWLHFETVVNYRLNSMYQGPCTTPTCTPGGPNPIDDTFYDESTTHTDSAIVFTDGNVPLYQIRYSCANPIGVAVPLVVPNNYQFDGESNMEGTDRSVPASPFVSPTKNLLVWPGDTVHYFHSVWNWGTETGTTRYAAWKHPRVSTPPAWTLAPNMQVAPFRPNPGNITLNGGTGLIVNWNSFTIPGTANVGDTYCQHIGFIPTGWDKPGATDRLDRQACAEVTYHYSLDPIAVADKVAAQQGDTVTFTYSVHNSGPTTSRSTSCTAIGNNHGPGYTPLSQQNGARTSDPGYVGPGTGCPRTFAPNTTPTLVTETVTIGNNLPPGSRLCRSLVIDPKDQWGGALTSEEACVVIAKAPYVHMTGNDVWAGGNFPDVNAACNSASKITTSSKTLQSGATAGSLGEYGVFALGKITNFGSASKALVDPAAAPGKMLTFSNTNSANLGFFGAPQHCINSYISTYNGTAVTSQPATIDVGGAGNGTWHMTGNHIFHGTMADGAQKIYLVEGDVTVDAPGLKYSDSYNSLSDIPSLVIIATGNILVRHDATQMDGVFVAKNTFNTCSDAPTGNLSVNDCNQQLTVNGSVIAGRLSLMRTFGAEGSNDDERKRPAEIFYSGAEMYLRNALTGSSVNTMRVVDEKDLPPRY